MIGAIKKVLSHGKYFAVFAAVTAAMFLLYMLLPQYMAGSNAGFRAVDVPWLGVMVFAALSASLGLLFSLEAYIFARVKKVATKEALLAGGGGISGAVSSVFSAAVCAGCVSAFFGFIGAGIVLFLHDYRWEIASLGLAITLVAVYFSAKRAECSSKC